MIACIYLLWIITKININQNTIKHTVSNKNLATMIRIRYRGALCTSSHGSSYLNNLCSPSFFFPILFFPCLYIVSFFLFLISVYINFICIPQQRFFSSCLLLPTRMLSEYCKKTFFFSLFNVCLYIFSLHTWPIIFFFPFLYYCQYIFCLYTSTILSSFLFLISVNTCSLCILLQ